MSSTTRNRWLVWLAVAFALVWATTATAESKTPLRLRTFAVDMTGMGRVNAGTIEITVERWSSDHELEQLLNALETKGSSALLSALQKVKPRAGFIRTSTSLGWDVQFAREEPWGDGGRRVIIATDRPMSFWERINRPRSVEYEFILAEIRLPKDGEGEGKLAAAAKISWNKKTRTLEIEDYAIQPVHLNAVKALEPTDK